MGSLGPTELLIILLVLVLLFGARKLPDLARGTGRALRIFKAETKGLVNDDDDETQADPARSQPEPAPSQIAPPTVVDPSAPAARPVSHGQTLPPTHTEK